MTHEDRIAQVAGELNKYIGNEVLSYLIAESAGFYWKDIQIEDFVLQLFGDESIVFGSINRVSWSPATGFTAHRSHCTAKFLKCYDSIGSLPGK